MLKEFFKRGNFFFLLPAHCPPSVHLSFDKYSQSALLDDSGSENRGFLANGAQIVPHGGKCGNAANLLGKLRRLEEFLNSFNLVFYHRCYRFHVTRWIYDVVHRLQLIITQRILTILFDLFYVQDVFLKQWSLKRRWTVLILQKICLKVTESIMCLTKDSRHPVRFWSQPNHNFPRQQAVYVKLKLVAMPFFSTTMNTFHHVLFCILLSQQVEMFYWMAYTFIKSPGQELPYQLGLNLTQTKAYNQYLTLLGAILGTKMVSTTLRLKMEKCVGFTETKTMTPYSVYCRGP